MKRFVIAVVAALSLLAGTGAASLAGPPTGDFFEEKCLAADGRSGQDFGCDY